MAENLQILRRSIGRKDNMQEEMVGENLAVKRTFTEVVKRPICKDINSVKVKVWREEIHRNLEKLEHCLVGSWNPRSGDGEDLEKLEKFLANSWGLKGRLGLAKLERNRILLEFESLGEAQRAFLSGERTMGGLRLRFEKWSPRTGCREEEEQSNEVWVRIYGLPVSLWNPTVLRRVGDECGGFVAIDPQTAKLEELQWARILVKMDGEAKPSTLEIGIEEEAYTLVFWWELRPLVNKIRVDSQKRWEVRGENLSRSGSLVEMESDIEKPEELLLSDEGTRRQKRVMGREGLANWAQVSEPIGYERRACGPSFSGLKLKRVVKEGAGPEAGPSKSWAFDGDGSLMKRVGPIKPTAQELVFERPEVLMHSDKGLGW